MHTNRPKLTIPKTVSERIWDIIGYVSYIGAILFLILLWGDLPSEVPAHYNAAGDVDRWGSKWELVILPGIGLFLLLFLNLFEKYPEWHNYPKRFNASNAAQFYLVSRQLINQLKNLSLIMFAVILYQSIAIALGWSEDFSVFILPLMLVCFILPIIIVFIKYRKIK